MTQQGMPVRSHLGTPSRLRVGSAWLIGVLLALVIVAPIALSSADLVRWAESPSGLGLTGPWPMLVFIALDAAAATCVLMVLYSSWRGDSGGVFSMLVWLFATGSAVANWSHGRATPAPHDEVFFPAMSLAGPLLLEATMSRVRRWTKQDTGRRLKGIGMADFGAWRWVPGVAFKETFAAWRTAHREGFTSPAEALAFVREVAVLAGLLDDADRLRYAVSVLHDSDPAEARAWLARRGVQIGQHAVDAVTAGTVHVTVPVPVEPRVVSRPGRTGRPALTIAPTPGPDGMSREDAARAAAAKLRAVPGAPWLVSGAALAGQMRADGHGCPSGDVARLRDLVNADPEPAGRDGDVDGEDPDRAAGVSR